jgi:lipid II:glycine glycyltransferase (peptidoglycan interpeptide bridge formation enzyme)
MKNGVKIKGGVEYLSSAYNMIKDTFARSKMGFMGVREFERYVKSLGENIKILMAEYQSIMQSCTVIPFSQHSAYYVYGGSISNPVVGATNLLHWEAIRQFREIGVKQYDFVGVRINPQKGSKQEGLSQYKERFGGQLIRGYIWKYPLRSLGSYLYNLAVRLQRGGDIVDAERHKLETMCH